MSEQDRLRAKLAHEFAEQQAPALAEQLYRVDKGYRHAKLDDLLTESSRQAYIEAARRELLVVFLGPAQRTRRITAVQSAIAQHHASKDDELEAIERQARRDVAKYGIGGIGFTRRMN